MFKDMSDWCMAKDHNGAECFSDGSRPLIAETKFADIVISGTDEEEVIIGVYPNGDACDNFYEGKTATKESAEQIGNSIAEYIDANDVVQFDDGSFREFFKALNISNIRIQD